MGYAKHVGRVGALAVALGIGAALATTPGVAWADGETENVQEQKPPEAPGEPTPPDSSSPPAERQDPGEAIRKRLEHAADDLRDDIRKAISGVVRSSGGAITSTHRHESNPSDGNVPPVVIEDDEEQLDNPKTPKEVEKSTPLGANTITTSPRSFTPPRWRAPQVQINAKPAPKPAAQVFDDVKDVVQQSVNVVTGNQPPIGPSSVGSNAFLTHDVTDVEERPHVRTGFVAPIAIITNVLNAAIAPFLNPTPGQPAPENPILWAVLGWVRRQVFNEAPTIRSIGYGPDDDPETQGVLVIDVVAEDDNAAPDELKYRATTDGEKGSVAPNSDGTFTYTPNADWDGNAYTDTVTVTVSDIGTGFHLHGLDSIFHPISAHATTRVLEINVPAAASGAPDVIELPEGHTLVENGSASVGADGKLYRPTMFAGGYAIVVQTLGSDTPETIVLPGEPVGALAFGPKGTPYENTAYQTTRTPDPENPDAYTYALTVINPPPATNSFALMAVNALDTGANTVALPGQPVGAMAIGSDGTAYQPIRAPGVDSPNALCTDCSVAIVAPDATTADIVSIPGQLISVRPNGSSVATPGSYSLVAAGAGRTAYLLTGEYGATSTVWRVDADTATAQAISLTEEYDVVPSGAIVAADGTVYKGTQVTTTSGTSLSYDTKLWVIAPDSDTATPFQLDGHLYGPAMVDDEGAAYQTTLLTDPDSNAIEHTVVWRVDPTGATAPTPFSIDGQPHGSVLVAPDGTAYQTIHRDIDEDPDTFVYQYLTAVISPGSTTPTYVDLGTYGDEPNEMSPGLMVIAPQGTAYQLVYDIDLETLTGTTTVFVFNGADHVEIPLEGYVATPPSVGADGRGYVVALTNIDQNTFTGDETLWVINPNSTQPVEVPLGTVGLPFLISVGGDSLFITTGRVDPSDPTTPIYEVVGVTIPS